jgi:hypothetical protein
MKHETYDTVWVVLYKVIKKEIKTNNNLLQYVNMNIYMDKVA